MHRIGSRHRAGPQQRGLVVSPALACPSATPPPPAGDPDDASVRPGEPKPGQGCHDVGEFFSLARWNVGALLTRGPPRRVFGSACVVRTARSSARLASAHAGTADPDRSRLHPPSTLHPLRALTQTRPAPNATSIPCPPPSPPPIAPCSPFSTARQSRAIRQRSSVCKASG
eukprot:358695-Chlamydomonas_euryale.AAC.5